MDAKKIGKFKIKDIAIGLTCLVFIVALISSFGKKSETATEDGGAGRTTAQESEQDAQKELVKRINKWFIEDYLQRPENQLMYEGKYIEANHKLSIVKGFRAAGDDIIAIYYHENLQAEGWEQKDLIGVIKVALYAYASSTNEELHFSNFDSGMDVESLKIAQKFDWYHTEAYIKDLNDIDL